MKWLLISLRKGIRNYFGFTQKETNGTILLLALLIILVFAPFFQNFFWSYNQFSNEADRHLQDSLVNLITHTNLEIEPSLPEIELSPFDPNQIGLEDWLKLGLNKKIAERIERYKSKGGKFRRKEDLLRVYDFPQDLYEALEPFIQIEGKQYVAKHKKTYEKKYQAKIYTPDTSKKWTPKEKKQLSKLNLNLADTAQLKRLRGIGEKRALNIIKFREKLGGFAHISQIEEIWGLDSTAIESLKKFAYIESNSWQKIAINTASIVELKKHPYISPKLANVLVNYRLQHGKFNSVEDLKKVKVLESNLLEKLLPYISFD